MVFDGTQCRLKADKADQSVDQHIVIRKLGHCLQSFASIKKPRAGKHRRQIFILFNGICVFNLEFIQKLYQIINIAPH